MKVLSSGKGKLFMNPDPEAARPFFRAKRGAMDDKVMSVQEAVARFVRDGDYFASGGFGANRISTAVLHEILRRKKRVLYATLGVVIAAMTVVGILTIANAGQTRIYAQLEKYGANLTIIPAVNSIDTKLGNLSLGTLSVGDNYIPESNMSKIRVITDGLIRQARNITDLGNIATIAPTLYINTQVRGISVIAAGVDPVAERNIKSWWEIADGKFLTDGNQAMIGGLTADLLKLKIGDQIDLNGTTVTVTGLLKETGSSEDYYIYIPLATLQTAYDKIGLVSTIDVRALCNVCPVDVIAKQLNLNVPGIVVRGLRALGVFLSHVASFPPFVPSAAGLSHPADAPWPPSKTSADRRSRPPTARESGDFPVRRASTNARCP